jgi:hypothetical protein
MKQNNLPPECGQPIDVGDNYVLQISSQLELWSEELQHMEISNELQRAEQILHLHNDSVSHMQSSTLDVIQKGQELLQVNILSDAGIAGAVIKQAVFLWS